MLGIHELEKKLVLAGRLKLRPLCIYGADEIPQGAEPSHTIDRCIAKAIFTAARVDKMRYCILMQVMSNAALEEWCGWDSRSLILSSNTS